MSLLREQTREALYRRRRTGQRNAAKTAILRPMPKSAADHVVKVLRAQRAALTAHEAGARRGRDPEDVRQMRTAIRRLRSVLRAAPTVVGAETEPLRRELDWLGDVLGSVRDLDVFGDYLRSELASLPAAESQAVLRVLERLESQRARATKGAAAALASARYTRLRKGLAKALGRSHPADEDVSLVAVARRRFKKLRKAVKALPERPSDEKLHAVRIRVKRARYAAELAEATVGRPARRFAKQAGRVQDILGEYQDAAVADARLRSLGTARRNGLDGSAMARLIERQRRRRRDAWQAFQDQWPKLDRRGRKAWY
jgi:CHAD domain-containing protein